MMRRGSASAEDGSSRSSPPSGALVACGDAGPSEAGGHVAPSASIGGAASASAPPGPSATALVSHTLGSVVSHVHPPRPAPADAPPPLDPPTFTRLPTAIGRRSDVRGTALLLPGGRLQLTEPGALHVIDVASGSGFSIRTGSPIFASSLVGTRLVIFETTGRLTVWP